MIDPDAELLQAVKTSRSRDALNELVGRHLGRVRRVIVGLVGADSSVDDLVQETFLRAVRGLRDFQGEAVFSTWLTRIALNVSRSHFASQNRAESRFRNDLLETAPAIQSQGPIEQAVVTEIETSVEQALKSLSPTLRAAIVLTVFEQMTPAQAAEVEQCPIGTMYWRIHEARRQLRTKLAEHLE